MFNFAAVPLKIIFKRMADLPTGSHGDDGLTAKLAWLVLKQPISGRIKMTVRFAHVFLSAFGHGLCILIGTVRRSIPFRPVRDR